MKQNPIFDRLTALADPIRARLLLVLERHELTVSELRSALQLPQSTVSRHLRALVNAGLVALREDGTSNRYRMTGRELDAGGRRLWQSVREEVGAMATAARDAERVRSVMAARHFHLAAFFCVERGAVGQASHGTIRRSHGAARAARLAGFSLDRR
jgi:DNA-binding transcriptional ArsR family regulator